MPPPSRLVACRLTVTSNPPWIRPRTLLLQRPFVIWISAVPIPLFRDRIVTLAALLLTLTTTWLLGRATLTLEFSVVVTGLLTRQIRWVLVVTMVLIMVLSLTLATVVGM